jgi:hypothetical protein
MLQAVAIILGKYPSDNDADLAARGKLLAPIFRQNDAIRDYLRARRPIVDINPETGEPEGLTGWRCTPRSEARITRRTRVEPRSRCPEVSTTLTPTPPPDTLTSSIMPSDHAFG